MVNICRIRIGAKLSMVEPISATLAGIALVQKSVDFIKSNIQTAQDIGQFVGAIDDAFKGEKECLKARDKKGADPFATENVAQEIIDAKLAREHLNQMKNLINLRFGPSTWDEILTERKRRMDLHKQAIKEKKAAKDKQMKEIGDILTYAGIGLVCIFFVGLVIYIMAVMKKANAIEIWGKEKAEVVNPCDEYQTDFLICMNEGIEAAEKRYHFAACDLTKKQPYYNRSVKCIYRDKTVIIASNDCPTYISCKDSYTK